MARSLSLAAALAILGLEPTATLPEARRAYRARARQVHPDRVEDSTRARAEAQMAELNEAWTVVETYLRTGEAAPSTRPARSGPEPSRATGPSSSGAAAQPPPPPRARPRQTSQRPRPERPAPTPRAPGAQECTICGWWPAAPLRLRWTTGLIFVWSVTTVVQTLCRRCGDSVYADLQARSLVRGWWGLLAPVANLVNLARNAAAIGAHRRLPEAEYRSPEVRTPLLWPSVATPVTSRPGPLLATTTAVGILVLFLVVIA